WTGNGSMGWRRLWRAARPGEGRCAS
ncbi:MAG: hypothetical protein AVDCRST_MAG19-2678, partial [uncultured Thermomicrobiales bacterium]